MGTPFRKSGYFLHGVNLDDWYPCWNLALSGMLTSPDFMASIEPGFSGRHHRIRDATLEELRTIGLPRGVPTPRAVSSLFAGAVPTQDVSRHRIELAFESGRREVAPEAPSRLSSLYLAEDSEAGRAHVRDMLGPDIHILRVVVQVAARTHLGDTRWYDLYCKDPDPTFIVKYWQSVPSGSDPATWEILIDGQIRVEDKEGLEHLRVHGAHRARDTAGVFTRPAEG
jgi:hypothetical protein